jgi:hypothetical protein
VLTVIMRHWDVTEAGNKTVWNMFKITVGLAYWMTTLTRAIKTFVRLSRMVPSQLHKLTKYLFGKKVNYWLQSL